MNMTENSSAAQLPALQRIKEKLERAGAKLPVENSGAPESAIDAGLSLALQLVEDEIRALNDSDDPPESVQVCYQAYQVVGSLLADLGKFETPEAAKILDNLSQARLVHDDVLPWDPMTQVTPVAGEFHSVAQAPITEAEIDRIAALTEKAMEGGLRGFLKTWGWQQFARLLIENLHPYGLRVVTPTPSTATPAWNRTTAELAAIYGEMAAINDTPAKDQTEAQRERLKALRAEAVEIGVRRYAMVEEQGAGT